MEPASKVSTLAQQQHRQFCEEYEQGVRINIPDEP